MLSRFHREQPVEQGEVSKNMSEKMREQTSGVRVEKTFASANCHFCQIIDKTEVL